MAQQVHYTCDGCGKIVYGLLEGTKVQRNYLQVKGTVLIQLYDEDTGLSDHAYFTRPPKEDLNFCLTPGMECMVGWIKHKKEKHIFDKRVRLSKEAEHESISCSGFEIGHKGDYATKT